MAWIKRNLFLLIAGVIALAALGYAVVFVGQKKDADAAVTASLDEAAEKYKQLLSRKVHPGSPGKTDNIKAATNEVVKIRDFAGQMREYIKGPTVATNLNNQIFRAMLDTSVTELRRQAEAAGVTLPNTNYWFTYTSYKSEIDFKDNLQGLAAQLEDIKIMMHILYNARVHSVVQVQRVPVSEFENRGTGDYIANKTPRTNDWAVITGYSITFQGFSSELARVMEGLANAKECFVVKSIGVAQAPEERTKNAPPPQMIMPPPAFPGGMGMGMDRYRYMQRPMMPMPVAQAKPTPVLKYVLDENKLRFTLQIDSIRLKPKGR
jgi:hypothetical protein